MPENTLAFLQPASHPDHLCAPSARPAPVSSSNEAAAEPSFATPHVHSPWPLWPIKVQLLRPPSADPGPLLELRTNCVEADDGTAAHDAAGRLVRPGSHLLGRRRSLRARRAAAPGRAGSHAAGPQHPHLPRGASSSLAPAPPPVNPKLCLPLLRARARGVQPKPVRGSLAGDGGWGSEAPARDPAASATSLGPQSPDPSVPPGSRGG